MSKNEEKETYIKKFYCQNCDTTFFESFDFGVPASQPACPYCGVLPYAKLVDASDLRGLGNE